jgi:hypothetical protein
LKLPKHHQLLRLHVRLFKPLDYITKQCIRSTGMSLP